MLNEDKIKLMTGISMFEKREGKKIFPINRFFRSDYVGKHLLRSFLGFTLCWFLGTAIVLVYKAEIILASLDLSQIPEKVMLYLIAYVVGLAVYLLITCFVYIRRYEYASRGVKVYLAKLKRLEKRYEQQSRAKEQRQGGDRS